MRNSSLPISNIRALVAGVVAMSVLAFACQMPSPTPPSPANHTVKLAVSSRVENKPASKQVLLEVITDTVVPTDSLHQRGPEPMRDTSASKMRVRVRERGVSAVQQDTTSPVIIVDGKRVDSRQSTGTGDKTTLIDPNAIQSIEVFTGPAASRLYGVDGGRGVIVITTKKGGTR